MLVFLLEKIQSHIYPFTVHYFFFKKNGSKLKGNVTLFFEKKIMEMAKARGLYANIHAKRKRIAAGSGEKMRRPGQKGRPTAKQFARAAKTRKEHNEERT